MSTSRYLDDDDDGDPSSALLPLPATASYPHSVPSTSTSSRLQSALERLASSKAKGKARATSNDELDREAEELEEGGTRSSGPTGMSFSVRFTEGEEDLVDLWVGEKATVREVKRRIRFLRPSLMVEGRPRRLRLIQLGRLLTDGTFLVPYTVSLLSRRSKLVRSQNQGSGDAILDGLEAATGVNLRGGEKLQEEKNSKGKGKETVGWEDLQGTEAEEESRIWLQCSVGEVMEDDEIEGERIQTAQITPLQGFDRLRDAGFSEEDIASMREEFRATAAGSLPAGGDEDEHARALEDQWMEGLTSQGEVANDISSTGVYSTLLQGVCVGFFVPFLPLFFFRTAIFSTRMQMAIVLGMCINLGFGLLRALS